MDLLQPSAAADMAAAFYPALQEPSPDARFPHLGIPALLCPGANRDDGRLFLGLYRLRHAAGYPVRCGRQDADYSGQPLRPDNRQHPQRHHQLDDTDIDNLRHGLHYGGERGYGGGGNYPDAGYRLAHRACLLRAFLCPDNRHPQPDGTGGHRQPALAAINVPFQRHDARRASARLGADGHDVQPGQLRR